MLVFHNGYKQLLAECETMKTCQCLFRSESETFAENVVWQAYSMRRTRSSEPSVMLTARNPKRDKQDALWSAGIALTALRGFLPALAGRKTPARSRAIDSLNQMLVRYLESVLKRPER